MNKIKKPNYKKWVSKPGMFWWQFVCLMAEIEPPKDFPAYVSLKSSFKRLKDKEDEMRSKGFFSDFGIAEPEQFN